MTQLPWLTASPVAHRGLHDCGRGIVENSGTAFEAAIAGGYAIECDIRLAADGIVVFHDADLDRLTAATGPVAAQNLATLRKTKLKGSDDRILILDEFLSIVGGRASLFVEFKADPKTVNTSLVSQAVKSLLGYKGLVAVMSFSPHIVGGLQAMAPHLPRGLVSCSFNQARSTSTLSAIKRFRLRNLLDTPSVSPHFIAYDINALPAFAPSLLRRYGLPLLSWTVQTPEHRKTARTYADQIIFEGFRPET